MPDGIQGKHAPCTKNVLTTINLPLLLLITCSTLTLNYTTLLSTATCCDKPFYIFSAHHPYYHHQPRVAKHTYLIYLATVPDTPICLPLGKYKFNTWFSPSEVLHNISVLLRNLVSYIYTYKLSTSFSSGAAGECNWYVLPIYC
jgi:hypothetical protein